MTRTDKVKRIGRILDELYPEPVVPLCHRDPFTLLVAVLLSAQTTDVQVNRVTPTLFALASTPAQMATLAPEKLLQAIGSCGLAPTKAKRLRALSRRLVEHHAGAVPASFAELERLPGVGHKTASVVMNQAFGVPAFPVDTHIHRLAARWGLSRGRDVTQTERDLKRAFAKQRWGRAHLQMIYFGREHCPARGHDLRRCPICSWAASKRRVAAESQRRRPRASS